MSRAFLSAGVLVCCCVSATARAGDFSWDLSGGATQSAVGDVDVDGSALAATHYFDPVDDSRGPYSLAPFFDPASRVSLAMNRTRQTVHEGIILPGAPDLTTTTDDYTVGGQYWLSASKWYAGGDYTKSDIDSPFVPGRVITRNDSYAYHVFAGKYLGPKTSLELGLKRSVSKSGQVLDVCPPPDVCPISGVFDFESKLTRDDVGVSFVHVRQFRSLVYSLFGGVTETSGHGAVEVTPAPPFILVGPSSLKPYWTWSGGGEVFPTPKLGIRVGFTRADYDGAHADSYDIAATWYFKRNIGIGLAWSKSQLHSDFSTPSVGVTSLRFIGRF